MNKKSFTENSYNKAADAYWEKVETVDQYNTWYDAFLELLPQNANILELGCGPGNVTQYVLNKRPDLHITGTDLASKMLALAKKNNPDAEFFKLDCREITTLNQKFDAIVGAFVMPYLNLEESAKLILDCASLLNSNGTLFISTMEGDYNQSGFENTTFSGDDKVYIHYHQAAAIKQNLKRNGFEIVHFIKQACPEPDGRIFTDMIVVARKI
ncbi:class I SAM-dependent DNA methyltransferase [Maribacter sp. HTCC2170]|uniref:class I SAM-dependent DNA methyltransferase n=1 Tax=Maribacter sp. (strain HTCC2170 / KCCM 42371) TaxID=313603 RepID=UPI00006AE67D|nr:class I SAM-dependent methyltransferase [Maribacter sp. HTCC2170]EAR00442.1 hypothetical protein FB2170_08054 [Maribacter sp. HTCC2170]